MSSTRKSFYHGLFRIAFGEYIMNKLIVGLIVLVVLVGGSVLYYLSNRGSEEDVLKVLNYSEYMDPEMLREFEEEYGVKIIYDEYEAAEEAWAK